MVPAESTRECMWRPDAARASRTQLAEFTRWINRRCGLALRDYRELWQWSVREVEAFWAALAEYYEVFDVATAGPALADRRMPGARWFPDAHCNFAQYLLAHDDSDAIAVHHAGEARGAGVLSWGELGRQVRAVATRLRAAGIRPGDRVVGYLPNSPEALIALLATTAVGAVWSCCSPDFGAPSVVERFAQLKPKLLFAVSGYVYNGKRCDRRGPLAGIVAALPTLRVVVHLPYGEALDPGLPHAQSWADWISTPVPEDFRFASLPFDHPLWVLFTSGTTGLPKGIVHGHGGILLEFLKSGRLHDDLGPGSVKFYYTSTGWTMFNLLIGGLATGSSVVLFDGQPAYPDNGRLWRLAEETGATYFGVSPAYIKQMMDRGYQPGMRHDLSRLRTLVLTGSPASVETFRWIYREVASDLHVISMSGGTDVATAFVGGVPTLPVHAGEIQAPGLGVAVQVWDESGCPLGGEEGELVVTVPMPSMPLYFLNDTDGSRYRAAYFEMFPGVWRQGDLIRFADDGLGCMISGRSDSTLNRHGIRIGTAEIYRVVEAIDGIADSLVVHLEQAGGWMPLFVVLRSGRALDDALRRRIGDALRQGCSARHVPDDVIAVPAIPYTLSGKKLEVPIKRILLGKPLERAVNLGAVANADAVYHFHELARTLKPGAPNG
ncbi:acetoacetate--CoA ligase [Sinimarinibacterium flocculans]|uniref:acetoacetate--CoA ligase n=1 Tax=Sinimarinibacterium flocculans TaxID=985250 RepID=UPI002490BEF6|nr:acetoacetate--CoA ligase [Sinimarinibacterium flocculans]